MVARSTPESDVEKGSYQVELKDLKSLKPYARNANKHPDSQIGEIQASMRARGWTNPMLVDEDDGIIAGHGRAAAASRIYAAGERIKLPNGGALPIGKVPVIVARGWTEEEKRAYVLHDNTWAPNWDANLLNFELAALEDAGFDMSLTGFDLEGGSAPKLSEKPLKVEAVSTDTTPVEARFWISLRGPLRDQARALDAVKTALGAPGEIEIELGVMA